jgi:DNA polymerase phi
VSRQWTRDKSSPIVKEFVSVVVELGGKKRYLTEPAVAVILDLVRKVHLSSTH